MKRLLIIPACIAAGIMLACQAPQTQTNTAQTTSSPAATTDSTTAQKKAPTDLEQLALRIVTQSAGVKENDIVLISGGTRDQELLENIAINVEKLGAFPLVTLNSDRMTKRSFMEVPEKYDSQPPLLGMKLADLANVRISVDSTEAEGLLAGVPPARLAARGKAFEPIGEKLQKNNVRSVEVGNGLYPTAWRAKRFDMSLDDLSKTFWEGVNVDYTGLQAKAEQVKAAIVGSEVHITNPNGTD